MISTKGRNAGAQPYLEIVSKAFGNGCNAPWHIVHVPIGITTCFLHNACACNCLPAGKFRVLASRSTWHCTR